MPKRGVDADQFVHQNLHRPAIGDDVVKSQHQHAFVRRQRQQQDPQQRSALQVERPMGLGFHQPFRSSPATAVVAPRWLSAASGG